MPPAQAAQPAEAPPRPCGPPPPCYSYDTSEQAIHAAQMHAYDNGYSLVYHRRYPPGDAESARQFTYRCAKGYIRKSQATARISKRRNTTTQMTNCSFTTRIKLQLQPGPVIGTVLRHWVVQEATHEHNHPYTPPTEFPTYRRKKVHPITEKQIIDLHKAGVRMADIMAQIDSTYVTRHDAYNLIHRHRRKEQLEAEAAAAAAGGGGAEAGAEAATEAAEAATEAASDKADAARENENEENENAEEGEDANEQE